MAFRNSCIIPQSKVFRNLTKHASAEEQQLSADMAMTLGMEGVDDCCGIVPDIWQQLYSLQGPFFASEIHNSRIKKGEDLQTSKIHTGKHLNCNCSERVKFIPKCREHLTNLWCNGAFIYQGYEYIPVDLQVYRYPEKLCQKNLWSQKYHKIIES